MSSSNYYRQHDKNRISLCYLNDFVADLRCASDLLDMKLYPDAKEVSESMGLYNATFFSLLKKIDDVQDVDGIVVVGDGATPRTAAMFALRNAKWSVYSIDPMMRLSSETYTAPWDSISNLTTIRNKIENVRIQLRRAIVILVHAHVSLEQTMSAIDATDVLGLITAPCCNWYGRQEDLFNRKPDLVYDDFGILSDHREIRIWCKLPLDRQEMRLDTCRVSGCVSKTYKAPQLDLFYGQKILQTFAEPLKHTILSISELGMLLQSKLTVDNILLFGDDSEQSFATYLRNQGFSHVHNIVALPDGSFRIEPTGQSFRIEHKTIVPRCQDFDLVLDIGSVLRCVQKSKKKAQHAVDIGMIVKQLLKPGKSFHCVSTQTALKKKAYFANESLGWTIAVAAQHKYRIYSCSDKTQPDPEPASSVLNDLLTRLSKPFAETVDRIGYQKYLNVEQLSVQATEKDCCDVSGYVVRKHLLGKVSFVSIADSMKDDETSLHVMVKQSELEPVFQSAELPFVKSLRLGDRIRVLGQVDQYRRLVLQAFSVLEVNHDVINLEYYGTMNEIKSRVLI